MLPPRPDLQELIGKDPSVVPLSCQRVLASSTRGEHQWIGPEQAAKLSADDVKAYEAAHGIMRHITVRAPTEHQSGHPGGPLSAFTFTYFIHKRRDPSIDQPMCYSAGHLSLLAYAMQWMFGREGDDKRLRNPQAIIDTFRTPDGLPGHIEAGIGDIPFGTGPLGKGVSNALGAAFGLQYLLKAQSSPRLRSGQAPLKAHIPIVDVLLADGDAQEGQVAEAFRLASALKVDNLVVHGDFNDIQLSDIPSRTMAADVASIAHAQGWHVIEVQNGNDAGQVVAALDAADALLGKGRPVFICYYTTMGQGISFMEEGSNTGTKNYHGTPLSKEEAAKALLELPPLEEAVAAYEEFRMSEKERYALQNSKFKIQNSSLPWSVSDIARLGYARTLTDKPAAARRDFGAVHLKNLMEADERIVVLHADLAGSGGFDSVQIDYPHRVINVGVAEANMVMMAAGMRQVGLLPVTYTFGAFGTNEARANARLIDINCAHTRCGVLYDCTHTGLSVGEDGETHQEQNYLNLPFYHTQVWMPADSNQSAAMAERAMEIIADGRESVFVFSPRTGHPQLTAPDDSLLYGATYNYDGAIDIVRGAGDISDTVTIFAVGAPVHTAVAAADALRKKLPLPAGSSSAPELRTDREGRGEGLQVRVLNVSCVRPIDASAVLQAALETRHLIVLEDHNTEGGLASQIADIIADFQLPCSLRRIGLTRYFPSGKAEDLLLFAGLDTESVIDALQDAMRAEVTGGEDAFVTAIFAMLENLHQSRFREKAFPFVERLRTEKGYLEALRAHWKKHTVPPGKLPKDADLRRRLGGAFEES